jgi:hypothetical protein
VRLAKSEIESAACDRNRLAAALADRPRVIFKNARGQRDFIARVGDRFSDGPGCELSEFFRVLANGRGYREQDLRAFARREIAPASAKRRRRATHRTIHVAVDRKHTFARGGLGRGIRQFANGAPLPPGFARAIDERSKEIIH